MIDLHTIINSFLEKDDTNKVFRLSSIAVDSMKPNEVFFYSLFSLLSLSPTYSFFFLFRSFLSPIIHDNQNHKNYGFLQFEIGFLFLNSYFILS